MATAGVPSRRLANAWAAFALCAAALLSACGANSYAGIPLAAGAADAELQHLARRAQAGDKHAQLELGIRYEEGEGVPVDLARAERLYRRAAKTGAASTYVYVPPVGPSGSGRVLPVRNPEAGIGLAEARIRLQALEARKAR